MSVSVAFSQAYCAAVRHGYTWLRDVKQKMFITNIDKPPPQIQIPTQDPPRSRRPRIQHLTSPHPSSYPRSGTPHYKSGRPKKTNFKKALRPIIIGPRRRGGGGQYLCILASFGRKHGVVLGLLVSLVSSGLKAGRSLGKVGGQHRRFQVSFLPIGALEAMLAAKI